MDERRGEKIGLTGLGRWSLTWLFPLFLPFVFIGGKRWSGG